MVFAVRPSQRRELHCSWCTSASPDLSATVAPKVSLSCSLRTIAAIGGLGLAQKFYRDYQPLVWPDLLARLTDANARLGATISSRSDDELYGRPWYGKWTKGRMIQFNTSSPYANARGRIRRWLRDQS